ncbi:MAG TPA: ribonuclease HI [Casimicrobiaceae bacterium]|nr:ribonuclease HI [Casimicrobiaceae bacterium]
MSAAAGQRTGARPVVIYTDGACKGNPGPGGWGALLVFDRREKEIFGGEAQTTNNRMELTAVIRALEALTRPCDIDLYLDSQYVKNGIESWIHTWKRNGWRTSDRKAVKNAELWRELELLVQMHRIRWHWVRGHADTPGNHRADELANRGVALVNGQGSDP